VGSTLLEATEGFFPRQRGRKLVLVLDEDVPPVLGRVVGDPSVVPGAYDSVEVHRYSGQPAQVEAVVGNRRDVLVLFLSSEFRHVARALLGDGRIAAVTCFSLDSPVLVERYLRVVVASHYDEQARFDERFTRLLASASSIRFRSPSAPRCKEVTAELRSLARCRWFSLSGSIPFGGQAVLPTGEISALTDRSGAFGRLGFDLDGEVMLRAMPIVHRGSADVSSRDAEAMYHDLALLADEPAVVVLDRGWVVELRPEDPARLRGTAALERLFVRDDRFRKVHEVGFGSNSAVRLVAANFFPNERHRGVHFGLGLGGHTDFHIDLVCPQVEIDFESTTGYVSLYNIATVAR
jgi:hypothetical protein